MALALGGDEREDALAVGLPSHQVRGIQLGQPGVQLGQPLDDPVVREQPTGLEERVRVRDRVRTGAGVTDVRDERRTA